jgi:hypothetical protein
VSQTSRSKIGSRQICHFLPIDVLRLIPPGGTQPRSGCFAR